MIPELRSNQIEKWLNEVDNFIFDCDGVLWLGDTPIKGSADFISELRSRKKRIIFVTNNSTKSRKVYVEKLGRQGIITTESEIITSASASSLYLRKRLGNGQKVFFIGEAGLYTELTDVGLDPIIMNENDNKMGMVPKYSDIDKDIKAVIVGLDRYFNYYKLAYGSLCIQNDPSCLFVATNCDPTYPVQGRFLPGGGSMVASIQCATGRPPDAVIGKPSQDLLMTILQEFQFDPSRTCMIGDRLSTDIEFGKKGGLQTLLVLSGCTKREDIVTISNVNHLADFYVDSVGTVLDYLISS